ncbi:MAG: hypothetical protein R2701_08085 [Acidimicrobiales bacterium]|nr:hypothetical protein [Acidimicrobiales bacterium]
MVASTPPERRPRGRRLARLAPIAVAAASALSVASCGADQGRTSLAIEEISAVDGAVRATVECATAVTAEVRPDPAGSGLLEVSLWGDPKVGRCHPEVPLLEVPSGTEKVVDGATGQVVEVG